MLMGVGKITISSIAEILNVSPITVSRALSGQPGVGEELREKIIEKAKELGYKKKKCMDRVSILFLIKYRYLSDNGNFSHMMRGIEKYIKYYGAEFTMELIEEEKQENFELPYNISTSKRFDGVILLGNFDDNYILFIQEKVQNTIVFNRYSYEVDVDYIYFNFNRTGYKAAKYLIDKGHSEIGFIGVEGLFNNPQRFMGFCKALETSHIALKDQYLIHKKEEMEQKVKCLNEEKNMPTAFICESDNTALKLIRLLYDLGVSVPEEVSIIGIGNTTVANMSIPSLTTFDLNIDYACEQAVRLVLNRIDDKDRPHRTIYIDTFLIERQSVKVLKQEV